VTKHLYQYFFRADHRPAAWPDGLSVLCLPELERKTGDAADPAFHREFYVRNGPAAGDDRHFPARLPVSQRAVGKLLSLIELPFTNLPVVKAFIRRSRTSPIIFHPGAAREPANGRGAEASRSGSRTGWADHAAARRRPTCRLPAGRPLAVYLPMGYMIGATRYSCHATGCSRSISR